MKNKFAIELLDLQIFSRVVELNGFTAAAGSLSLPKSSVSRRITQLEEQLGVRLLQRTTRRISLTDAGRLYYQHAQRILAEVRDAQAALATLQGRPAGELRITLPLELGSVLLNELLLDFMQSYPAIKLEVEQSNQLVDLVAEGFDLAIRASHLPLSDSSLVARLLGVTRFAVYASPDYLQQQDLPLTPEELSGHNCLNHSSSELNHAWELFDSAGRAHRVEVDGSLVSNSFALLAAAAERGQGIALLPDAFATQALAAGRLECLLEGFSPSPGHLYALYPSRRYLPPKVSVLLDFLTNGLNH